MFHTLRVIPRTITRPGFFALLTASALSLSACTGTDSTPTRSASAGSTAATSTPHSTLSAVAQTVPAQASTESSAGISALGNTDTAMKTQRLQAPAQLLVTGVRVGKHDGFTRVVFDLDGQGSPGWFVDYTDSPQQQGSGNPIPFNGTTALNVNIDGTVLPFEVNRTDPNIGTVDGQGAVTHIIPAGTFEGRSQFIVGLDGAHPYSVQVLPNPTRLVIDIQAS